MALSADVPTHPVQTQRAIHKAARCPQVVTRRAYEVYCEVFGEQPALMDEEGRGCRGGFGSGELIALLYAHSYPRQEWKDRVNEALCGMEQL